MLRAFVLACLALFTLAAAHYDLIRPGDEAVDASGIASGEVGMVLLVSQEGRLVPAARLRLSTRVGDSTITRVETMRLLDGTVASVDSFVVARETLEPLSHYGTSIGEDPEAQTFDGSAFYANSVDLLLGALPLREGYSTIAAFTVSDENAASGATTEKMITIVGRTTVDTRGEADCPAWEVSVTEPETGGVYWVSMTDRTLLQFVNASGSMRIERQGHCPEARVSD